MSELEDSARAPGAPGIAPTWTSSANDLVGGSLGPARLWFSIGRGIVNEVYYPRVDLPQIRDLGFIVADDAGFWVEIKRLNSYTLKLPGPGIPAAQAVHRHERFTLMRSVSPDPLRDVLLIEAVLDGWNTVTDTPARSGGLGLFLAALPAEHLQAEQRIDFTFRTDAGAWSGVDYQLRAVTSLSNAVGGLPL